MTHRIHLLGLFTLGGALSSTGCGRAVNLLNADGPQFLASYAPARPTATPESPTSLGLQETAAAPAHP
jgi:hypothetical protein